jgi:hypothetical protein
MKNKGRKHLCGIASTTGSMNCKGALTHITRPIRSMSGEGEAMGRFDKKKWVKRMRGYLKSQTKEL